MKNSGKTIGSELALYTEINAKGWTIRKFMGGGGGILELHEFFSLAFPLQEYFF